MDTYADWLRARADEELHALLSARPELINPVPSDLGALAARATNPAGVGRALDRLDRFALTVLETMLVLPQPVGLRALGSATGDRKATAPAVRRLRTCGLVWGDDKALRTAPGVRHALPHPAGLGPLAREALATYPADRITGLLADLEVPPPNGFADPASLAAALADRLAEPGPLIDDAGPEARAALNRLTWGPPVGRVDDARRSVRVATANSPIERLLARGLLIATDDRSVVLPREVALHLRGGRLFSSVAPHPPALEGPQRARDLVDRTAGGQALTLVRLLEDLLERWGVAPPAVLRSGGLAVRDLRATAQVLEVEEWVAALLIEIAYAAGLLARSGVDGEWLPTRAYDVWRIRETADRWAEAATAWLTTDRVPGLAGDRDDRDRVINTLADESMRSSARSVRRATLAALATTACAPGVSAVQEYLAWQEPRRSAGLRDRLVAWTLREAEVLGVTGLGTLAAPGRALLDGDPVKALAPLLPEPVDHVLIQGDLTAIAPGPLVAELGRELALMADVESTGGATVYRFTPASVRRALDVGRTAAELADLLARHSATPVPQPLTYLIDDVARRHGHLRAGSASSYLRCDDPATLDEVLAGRRAAALRAHRLAPTVIASRLPRVELLELLRSMGFAPVAESPEGGAVMTRPDAHRAEPSALSAPSVVIADPDPSVVAAAVRALRAGDEASQITAPLGEPPRGPSMATVEELREAVSLGSRVWIGYLDQQGQTSSRIVEPVRVEGGFLTAYDATRASIQRFALHRITGVAAVN
ncbi:MAG TPA: helicase-associated domain-containing protein [Streptosporangiaceae bacterium]|nr:helicase-associated domain-containing protein [Streptosporangiaceae bacterium]